MKTIGSCGPICVVLVEILCVLEEEIGLVCWQLPHDVYAMEIFLFQPICELS